MPLLSTFGAASTRGFGNLSGIALPSDNLFNTVSFLAHFDGDNNGVNNSFDDSSSSNHTITANGNVTQGSFGPFARADGYWGVAFDGTGDRLRTNAASLDVTTEEFTAEAWIFPVTDMDQYDIIVCMFDSVHSGNNNQTWSIRAGTSNTIEMITISGSTQTIQSAGTVNIGAWNHVAISRSGTTMYAALNGTVTSASCASSLNGHEYFYIGAADANGSASYFFNGSISNVRYEIGNARYTSSYTPTSSALTTTANTKLLTCQSNRFFDNSTSAHTITASGNPAVSAFGPFLTSEVYDPAVHGASAYFDGAISELNTPDTSDFGFGTGDFTWEAWIYALDTTGVNSPYIFDFRAGGNTNNGSFYINNTNSGRLEYYGNGVVQGDTAVPLNEWVHVACVRSGTTIKLYQAGVEVGSGTNSSNLGSSGQMVVGDYIINNNNNFKGYISDVRIDKGTAVYTSAFTPPTAPLTAVTNTKLLLNMADAQAIDSSAQHNLTLFGNAKISNTQSKFGDTSLVLDGTGDFAIAQGFNDLSGPFTIECFARADDTTNAFLWCVGVYKIELGINGNDLRIYTASGYTNFFTSGEFTANNWHHVALVRDTSNVIKLYLNGTASSTTITDSTTYAAGDGLFIGGEYASATSINHGWDGYIDDFRVSNTARYTADFTPPTEAFPDKGQ